MAEDRNFCTKQSEQYNLPSSRIKQIGAADNVGDVLKNIINDNGQLISKKPILAMDDKVTDLSQYVLLLCALNQIIEWKVRVEIEFM